MRQFIFITIFFFSCLHAHSQLIQKGIATISGAIGVLKPSSYTGDLNNHPLMVNLKAGYFVKRGFSVGIEFQSTTYTEQVSGIARLQQPGSNYTERGTIKDKFVSIGLYSDLYAQIGRKLFFIPGVFVHYLHNSYTDKGEIYSNGDPTGIIYSRGTDFGYYTRTGANLTICYFLNPQLAISLRCAEFEIRMRRTATETFVAAPLMVGVQYHFNPKK